MARRLRRLRKSAKGEGQDNSEHALSAPRPFGPSRRPNVLGQFRSLNAHPGRCSSCTRDRAHGHASANRDQKVFRKHSARLRKEVVIPILAKMRKPAIERARQTLTIGSADLDLARLLGVPLNSPVAEVRRVFNSADGRVIYLGEVTYRGDFVRIEMNLKP